MSSSCVGKGRGKFFRVCFLQMLVSCKFELVGEVATIEGEELH